MKQRQNSPNRTRAVASILDIYTMMVDMLLPIGIINVIPADKTKMPKINPEKLLPESVVERLDAIEAEMNVLKLENANLREEVSKMAAPPTPDE